ncbi:MAG: D-amino-acid transaminase [Alphaproteobacteria bacterium]
MSRIAYVNGRYVPHREASVHVEDRGYQFSDGVYEVIAVEGGRLVDEAGHLDRLERSLGELRIARPMGRPALGLVMREVLRRNRVEDGIIYIQMTRGVAPRDHAFPKGAPKTAVVMTARRKKAQAAALAERGAKVITIPDIRWERCDIKAVALLPNVLGKQKAVEAGAFEAWQVGEDGFITEGTSTNAWIVTDKGELVTRQTGPEILTGVTRLAVMALAEERQLKIVERAFTVAEAKAAREAFLTSTTSAVLPVVAIDGTAVGDGKPGPLTRALREYYLAHAGA